MDLNESLVHHQQTGEAWTSSEDMKAAEAAHNIVRHADTSGVSFSTTAGGSADASLGVDKAGVGSVKGNPVDAKSSISGFLRAQVSRTTGWDDTTSNDAQKSYDYLTSHGNNISANNSSSADGRLSSGISNDLREAKDFSQRASNEFSQSQSYQTALNNYRSSGVDSNMNLVPEFQNYLESQYGQMRANNMMTDMSPYGRQQLMNEANAFGNIKANEYMQQVGEAPNLKGQYDNAANNMANSQTSAIKGYHNNATTNLQKSS